MSDLNNPYKFDCPSPLQHQPSGKCDFRKIYNNLNLYKKEPGGEFKQVDESECFYCLNIEFFKECCYHNKYHDHKNDK